MKPHISIIGMPWSGKSTTSLALANKLGFDFIDLDNEVEKREGKKLTEVMKEKGATYFREMQYHIMQSLAHPYVISPAGSIIYYEPGIQWLKQNSKVIFLNTSLDVIKSRMEGNPKAVSDLHEGIDSLYKKRLPMYLHNSDYVIDTANKELPQIVDEITSVLHS